MLYKIKIHSVDLQDHDGFLAFLNAHSHDGFEAIRVYRTFTIFKKTDAPPVGYSMRFFPDYDLMDEARIPGLQNGVEIRPVAELATTPDSTWTRTVIENYKTFTQNNFGLLISKVVRRILIPAVLFIILLLFGGELFHTATQSLLAEFEGAFHEVLLLLVLAGILILVNAFSVLIDFVHLKGLKKALNEETAYMSPPGMRSIVAVKNLLMAVYLVPCVIIILKVLIDLF